MNITKMFDNDEFLEEHPQNSIVKRGWIPSYLYNIELKLKELHPEIKIRDYTETNNRHYSQNNLVGLGNNLTEKLYWLTDEVVKQRKEINALKKRIAKLESSGGIDDDGK